ncbi:hypothetical protein MBANPS3_001945 [Mucor bainieri]
MLSSPPTTTTHNSLMFELDDEDSNLSTAASPNAHEFLNFSRRITERSLKKPVDTQNAVKISSPLVHQALNPASKPTHANAIHHKPIPHKNIPDHHQKSPPHLSASSPIATTAAAAAALPQQPPITTIKSKSNALEELVADVLNYIDSCPDQSAYSYDLAKLKPKLEAISSGKPQS